MTRAVLRLNLVLGCLVILSACVDLPGGEPPPAQYILTPATEFPDQPRHDVVIFVEEPTVAGQLRSSRIPVVRNANKVEYYPGAEWADRIGHLLRRHLIISLDQKGGATLVGTGAAELPSDYRIKIDVREFQAVFDGGRSTGEVHVSYAARLVTAAPPKIVSAKTFTHTLALADTTVETAVAAFDTAVDRIVADIAEWIGENDLQPRAGR